MVSRLSAAFQHGSGTSRLTLRDRARRVVAHLLLQRPTGPSPRRRLAAAERRALRMRTSSSSRCARPPAGSRVSHLGIVAIPHIYIFASQVDKVKKAQPDNLCAKYLDKAYYKTLQGEDRDTFYKCVRTGIDNPDSGMGCYAMTPGGEGRAFEPAAT